MPALPRGVLVDAAEDPLPAVKGQMLAPRLRVEGDPTRRAGSTPSLIHIYHLRIGWHGRMVPMRTLPQKEASMQMEKPNTNTPPTPSVPCLLYTSHLPAREGGHH